MRVVRVGFIGILIFAFHVTSVYSASCNDHPWSNGLPQSLNSRLFKVITDLSYPVVESEIEDAKLLLKDLNSVEVSDKKASTLIGETFTNTTAYRLYLVRGLKDNESANVVVYRYKDLLFLESIGMDPAKKVTEAPVVVKLDVSPSQVYVSCIESAM